MYRRRRSIAAVAGTIAVLSAAALAIGPVASAQETDSDEPVVLTVGTTVDLDHDNVFAVSAGNDWTVATTEYDMLLKFDSADLSAAPSLAEGCEPDETYMRWTCTLREGLTWSDGEPLTSEDVAFTYEFVMEYGFPQYASYFWWNPVFETPDDRTLVWIAEEPTFAPEMPPWVYIVPEHVWGQYMGADRTTIRGASSLPAVGSGPFQLTEWVQGQSWTMTKNPYYWGEEPAVDEIRYRLYTNATGLIQALKNGEVDAIDGVEASLKATLEEDPNITTQVTIADWWLNLAFNFGGQPGDQDDPLPALHDIELRRAIAMAIDKEEIVEQAYFGLATPGDTIIRPASTFWHLDIPAEEEIPYDPAGANAILDTAGYADTDDDGVREDPSTGEPLHLDIPASEPTAGAVDAGQLITGYLGEIGVEVNLMAVSDGKMGDYWDSGDFDAYIWYWSGDPDPNYQLYVFSSAQCGNWSDGCWKDPEFDALYEEQRGIMDFDERQQVVYAAQQEAYDEIPGVVLAYPNTVQAYRNDRFEGWVPHPGENGYIFPSYNHDSFLNIAPVTAQSGDTSSDGGGIAGWAIGAAVAAGVVAIVVVMARGRSRRISEEEA